MGEGLLILVVCTGQIWDEHYAKLAKKSEDTWCFVSPEYPHPIQELTKLLAGRPADKVLLHCQPMVLMQKPIMYRALRAASQGARWFHVESV